jgi:hypothetical protein
LGRKAVPTHASRLSRLRLTTYRLTGKPAALTAGSFPCSSSWGLDRLLAARHVHDELGELVSNQRSPAPSARLAGSLKHALHSLHSGILRFLPGRNGSHCPLKQPAVLADRPQKMPGGLVARLDLEAVRVRRWIVHPAYMAQPARAYHRGPRVSRSALELPRA